MRDKWEEEGGKGREMMEREGGRDREIVVGRREKDEKRRSGVTHTHADNGG